MRQLCSLAGVSTSQFTTTALQMPNQLLSLLVVWLLCENIIMVHLMLYNYVHVPTLVTYCVQFRELATSMIFVCQYVIDVSFGKELQ